MQYLIKRYPVLHPLLKDYVSFFWEIRVDHVQLNHKLVPLDLISLSFNLSDTPQILSLNGYDYLLENVYFAGLQDHFINAHLKLNGTVHIVGISFFSYGFFPFLNIPMSEFRNIIMGVSEIGFSFLISVNDRLKEAPDINSKLEILENELLKLLIRNNESHHEFRKIFNALHGSHNRMTISEFCNNSNIGVRSLERMYNKYVGLSPNSYGTLNRFHNSLTMLINKDFSKLSDLAYDQGFFDQMHFIKQFKRFTGNAPAFFMNDNNSIVQLVKLS